MPIKHLEARFRLPRLGVIGSGVIVEGPKGPHPEPRPYFVIPEELAGQLGEPSPTKIEVAFPSDDLAVLFPHEYVRHRGRLVDLKCDGERYVLFQQQKGPDETGACQRDLSDPWKPCPCKAAAEGKLHVIVLGTPLGIWQVRVGGLQGCADILSELRMYRGAFGRLTNIPFWVVKRAETRQYRKENGEIGTREYWPIHLTCEFTPEQAYKLRGIDLRELREISPALPPHVEEELNGGEELESDRAAAPPRADAPEEHKDSGSGEAGSLGGGGANHGAGNAREILSKTLDGETRATAIQKGGEAASDATHRAADEEPATRGRGADTPSPSMAGGAWTIERCYKAAQSVLGVTPKAYELYLQRACPRGVDGGELATQRRLFLDARENPTRRTAFKAAVLAAANKQSRQGRLV